MGEKALASKYAVPSAARFTEEKQVRLTPEQAAWLAEESRLNNCTASAVVRDAIALRMRVAQHESDWIDAELANQGVTVSVTEFVDAALNEVGEQIGENDLNDFFAHHFGAGEYRVASR